MSVDAAFERSVRRWLWAYPRRWRWARADEVVGTLADLAGPGATRLDVRSGLGLVVHGLVTRRRMRPPLGYTVRFGLVNAPPPWQHRGWVADRIASPLYPAGSIVALTIILAQAAWRLSAGLAQPSELVWWGTWVVALALTPRTRARRDAAARHLVARPGDPPAPWDLRPAWVYRDRLTARSTLPDLAVAGAAVTGGAAAVTLATGSGRGLPLLACAALGILLGAWAAVRWRRVVATRPAQPARRLLAAGRRWHVSVCCWATTVLLLSVTGPWASASSTVAPLVLGVALVVTPSGLVGYRLARRAPGDLALVDLWFAVGARSLPVDAVLRGVVPAWEPPPEPGPVPLPGGPTPLPPTPGVA